MKKKLCALLFFMFFMSYLYAGLPVNEKVLKSFNETFKQAKDVEWFVSPGMDTYLAYFKKDDIDYRITYDKDGRFLYSIRYYKEDNLPMYILFKLRDKYKGRSIYGVTEVINDGGIYYNIVMEDKANWWIVKITSNEFMQVTQKLRKP